MAANTQTAQMQYLDQGNDIFQLVGPGGNVTYSLNNKGGAQFPPVLIAASGAINPRIPGFFVITKAGVAAMTLAAPTAGTDDGLEIEISSATNFAHTVTATGLLLDGTAGQPHTTVTFAAQAGCTVYLTAYQGKWIAATGGNGVTFS